MGRKRKSYDEKKHLITIRLSGKVIKELTKIENYNDLIERLILTYLKRDKSK